MEGIKLKSGKVQVRSGLVQVWFSLQLKFSSFELDSDNLFPQLLERPQEVKTTDTN